MSSQPTAPTPQKKKKPKPIKMSLAEFNAPDKDEVETYFGELKDSGSIDPSKVMFSQTSAGNSYTKSFEMNGKSVKTLEEHSLILAQDGTGLNLQTPAIDIVYYKGHIMCVTGNRRLWVHKKANKAIPYNKLGTGEQATKDLLTVDPEAPRTNLTIR